MAIFTVIFFLYTIILSPMTSSLNPDSEALLQLKKSFTNTQALDSWQPGSEPCSVGKHWVGLVCYNGMVTGLHLKKMGLSGKIDVDALLQMHNLRSLSITNNSFSGPIPLLNRMGGVLHLKGLYLSANQFSGEIPSDYFKEMASLRKLWLSENNFTGDIPSSVAQISHLISLHLENNKFSGPIPEFRQQTLISLNLSNNNLQGEIPLGLSKFSASSFAGNAGLCGKQLGKPCNQIQTEPPTIAVGNNSSSSSAESSTNYKGIAYGLMALFVFIFGLMGLGIIVLVRKQDKKGELEKEYIDESMASVGRGGPSPSKKDMVDQTESVSIRKSLSSRRGVGKGIGDLVVVNDKNGVFGLADLMKAAAEVLGNGSVGSSYKTMMPNGFTVVVKRIRDMNKIGNDGFDAQITRMAGLRHPNILTPLAYHCRKEEKLLIYDYISRGSLLDVLHGDRGSFLSWPARLKIVKGVAGGLDYLHTQYASSNLPHGNLKSSNVLIASSYEPLLVDYGLNSLISSSQVTQLFAYKSPEVSQGCQVSPKCDVYCLGILILEVIIRKFSMQYLNHGNGGNDVIEWVKSSVIEGREAELLDPDIANAKDALGEMQQLLQIGAACAESNPEQRLDIREATRRIEEMQIEGTQDDTTHALQLHGSRNVQNDNYQAPEYKDRIKQQIGDSFGFHRS